jgi:hypothetical protein
VQHSASSDVDLISSSSDSGSGSNQFNGLGVNGDDIPEQVETGLQELVDIIDKLYKFAIDIKNSATRSGPGDRNPFRKFSTEEQRQIIWQFSRYEEILIARHIRKSSGLFEREEAQADSKDLDVLKARCGRANVLRRQYFRAWKAQRDENKKVLDDSRAMDARDDDLGVVKGLAGLPEQSAHKSILQPSRAAPSVQQTVTTLDPTKLRPRATGSSYSRASRMAPSREPGGEKPPWPSINRLPRTDYFPCPYCFLICPKESRLTEHAWR